VNAAGKYWQCKVRPVRGRAMWDWSKMKQGEEGWQKHYRNHRCYQVAYLAWPEGADYAWVVGKEAMTLAGWKQVYGDMVVDDDIEDMQDLNVVQEAGSMIERGEVVHEVCAWAERRFKGADGAAQRAALTLAAQRVGPLPAPSTEELNAIILRKLASRGLAATVPVQVA
jgi:predicted HD phosphohydrolase